jgi:hypothetical protein
MENQGYSELFNRKQLATYEKITTMCKVINDIRHMDLNIYGSLIFGILLQKIGPQIINIFEKNRL